MACFFSVLLKSEATERWMRLERKAERGPWCRDSTLEMNSLLRAT